MRRVRREPEKLLFLIRGAGDQIVEDVEVALARRWTGNAAPLEIIVERLGTDEPAAVGELELGVLAEARGVCVLDRARIAESFEDELQEQRRFRSAGA